MRLKAVGVLAALFGSLGEARGQEVAWAARIDRGIVQNVRAIPGGIAPAPAGDVYVAGLLGANGGSSSKTSLTRYDASGGVVWSRTLDVAVGGGSVGGLAADAAGNVLLAFSGTRGEEGRGPWSVNALVSYDAAGTLRWKRSWDESHPISVAADSLGRFAVVGLPMNSSNAPRLALVDGLGKTLWIADLPTVSFVSSGLAVTVDASNNVCAGYSLYPPPGDIGVECHDGAGVLLWRRTYDNGATHDAFSGIARRPGGGVYVVGKTSTGLQSQVWTLAIGPTGDLVWGAAYGGATGQNDEATALSVSSAGDVFVAGAETSGFATRAVALRYDAAGTPAYAVTISLGQSFAVPEGLGVDSAGSAYLGLTAGPSSGPVDAFAVRLDPAGSVLWSRSYGSSASGTTSGSFGLVTLASGGAAMLVGVGMDAMATLRYSSAGAIDWTKSPPAQGFDEAGSLARVDGLGRLIVAGLGFDGRADAGLVTALTGDGTPLWTQTLSAPIAALSTDRFGNSFLGSGFPGGVTKLGADGQVQWSLVDYGAPEPDDLGGAFVAGRLDSGGPRLRITRYSPSGDVVWARDDLEDPAGFLPLPVLAKDGAGGVAVAEGLASVGTAYMFRQDQRVLRYAGDGTPLWATTLQNPEGDRDTPTSIAVDAAGSTYVSTLSWVQDPVVFTVSDSSLGLVKLDRDGKVLWARSTPAGLVPVPPLPSKSRLALDGQGHVFLAGSRKIGPLVEIVLLCYDDAGTLLWQRAFDAGGAGAFSSGALAVDGAGNAYVGGMAIDDPSTDFLVLKYDPVGTLLWAHRVDGAQGFDAAADLAGGFGGAVYAAGTSWVEPTSRDLLLVRYGTPPPGARFFTVPPCRALDTRALASGPSPVAAGGSRVVDVAGSGCGVPDTARAVAGNLSAVLPTAAGHLVVSPAGEPTPFGSSLNYDAGQTRAGSIVAGLSQGGRFVVRPFQASGNVHLIVDVTGYYQ